MTDEDVLKHMGSEAMGVLTSHSYAATPRAAGKPEIRPGVSRPVIKRTPLITRKECIRPPSGSIAR